MSEPVTGEVVHRNTRRVVETARGAGLSIAPVRFRDGTRTAADAARAVGCGVERIVKSIVLVGDGRPVLVLTAGSNRVDEAKVASLLGCGSVRRASADEVRAATGFPIGGAAPWGHPAPLPVLCDAGLVAHDEVWAAAGTPDTVFRVAPGELVRVSGARVADVAE